MTETNNRSNISVVDDVNYGVYVWRTDDGSYVGDEDGNYMLIASRKGDQKNIAALERSARYYGIEGGQPEFRSGARPVSQSEYEDQVARQRAGLVPDKYDLGSLLDDYRAKKSRGEA